MWLAKRTPALSLNTTVQSKDGSHTRDKFQEIALARTVLANKAYQGSLRRYVYPDAFEVPPVADVNRLDLHLETDCMLARA
jgi:hypothetical protein